MKPRSQGTAQPARPPAFFVLVLLGALSLLGGCQAGFFAAVNAGGDAPTSVTYLPEHGLALDIYRPPASREPAPVVVFLYGGRWQDGTRAEYGFVGRKLASHGVLTLVIDYRLYPQVRFPAFVEDTVAAVAWAREHAAAHGGDPTRLFLIGHSAGAHIAALIGTDARFLAARGLQPRDLAGVIGIAGPYDFLPLEDDDLRDIFGPEERWPESQPINFVDGDEPPFLLLHGNRDLLVWLRNSERLKARFDAIGAPVELRRYNVGHIRILSGLRYEWLTDTTRDVLDFVRAQPAMPTIEAVDAPY